MKYNQINLKRSELQIYTTLISVDLCYIATPYYEDNTYCSYGHANFKLVAWCQINN